LRTSLGLIALLVGCHHAAEEAEEKRAPAAVTCSAVEAAQIDETIDVSGVIAPPPKLRALVGSQVAGRIARVYVEEGDPVAAGALIAMIEDPALPAGTAEARAVVAAAEAAKAAADVEVARQQRLVTTGIGARKDLDDAKARAATTAAELAGARARSGLASSQLSRREIRAPQSGVVLHLYHRAGETVDGTGGSPIAEVADISTLELHAQTSPGSLARLHDGLPASIHVLGIEAPIAGTVARVAPAVDPTTLLGQVRIALASSENVKVGTSATAQIAVATRPGIRIPATALRRSMVGDDEVVTCVNGTAKVKTVKVGIRSDKGVAILEGLAAGDRVVTDHALGLDDGQPLDEKKLEEKK
jgi:RND family efflux transporter MFP subunit